MKFLYNSETKLTDITTDTDDICALCKFFDLCPLTGALETNIVYPCADKLTVSDCAFFEAEWITDEYTD